MEKGIQHAAFHVMYICQVYGFLITFHISYSSYCVRPSCCTDEKWTIQISYNDGKIFLCLPSPSKKTRTKLT